MELIISYVDAESLETLRKETREISDLNEAKNFILEDFKATPKPKIYRIGFLRIAGSWQTIDPYNVIMKRIQKMEQL